MSVKELALVAYIPGIEPVFNFSVEDMVLMAPVPPWAT